MERLIGWPQDQKKYWRNVSKHQEEPTGFYLFFPSQMSQLVEKSCKVGQDFRNRTHSCSFVLSAVRDWLASTPLSSHSPSATMQRQKSSTRLTHHTYSGTMGKSLLPFLGGNQANQARETPKVELRKRKPIPLWITGGHRKMILWHVKHAGFGQREKGSSSLY